MQSVLRVTAPFSHSGLFGPHYSALSVTFFQKISNDPEFKRDEDVIFFLLPKTFQTGFAMCLSALPLVHIMFTASITNNEKKMDSDTFDRLPSLLQ